MQEQLKLQNISINEIFCLAYLVKSNEKERALFLYRNLTITTTKILYGNFLYMALTSLKFRSILCVRYKNKDVTTTSSLQRLSVHADWVTTKTMS